ncbi:hypothetical protein QQP08_015963 [Theobroma cacao]|nr:hypothetical protein QQP08_015963 [Theobroma cacao]
MTKEDEGEISPEIITVSELNYYIERIDQKMIDLVHKNGKTGEDETNKTFRAETEVLKKDQLSVKRRVNEFMTSQYCQLDDRTCTNLDPLTSLCEESKTLKLEDDEIKHNGLIGLSLGFDKANEHVLKSGCGNQGEDQLKVKSAGLTKDKDHVKKWLNQVDMQFNFSFGQWEENEFTLISESVDSEEEEEEVEEPKQEGDSKERFLAKLIEYDSIDELEDEEFICNGDEGCQELKKQDTVEMEDDWMNYLQLDGFDQEFDTNIDGLKEEMSAMMFQEGKYKRVKYNEKKSS